MKTKTEQKPISFLFIFWYLFEIPSLIIKKGKANFLRVVDMFSLLVHIRTLFAPWKQDVMPTKGVPIEERFKIYILNLTSRIFGFGMRIIVMATGVVALVLEVIFFAAYLATWFLLPAFALVLIIYGIVNMLV